MSTINMDFAEMQAIQQQIAELHQTTQATMTGQIQQLTMTLNRLANILPGFHEPGMTYLHTLHERFEPFLEEHRALFVDELQTIIQTGERIHTDAKHSLSDGAS